MKKSLDSYKNVFYVPDMSTMVPALSPDHLSVWKDYFLRSRWEGRGEGGVEFGGGGGGGMTPTLRFMQMQGALEGRSVVLERVEEENRVLRKRVEGLRGVVREKLGEEVLGEVDGEEGEKIGEGGEGEGEEKREGEGGEGQGGDMKGMIEQLHARILFLEKELKEERENTRYLVLETPASSSSSSPPSSFLSTPNKTSTMSAPLTSMSTPSVPLQTTSQNPPSPLVSYTSSPNPPSFISSPLPNRNAPLPPTDTFSPTSQKSLSSLLPSSFVQKANSLDFSDWAILSSPGEEKEKEREKEKGKGEERVLVLQKRRLGGQERATPSPSSGPIE